MLRHVLCVTVPTLTLCLPICGMHMCAFPCCCAGWELPVSWIERVPRFGHLTLTYSSDRNAGCAPVWESRQEQCKEVLVHPVEGGVIEAMYEVDVGKAEAAEAEWRATLQNSEASDVEDATGHASEGGDTDEAGDGDVVLDSGEDSDLEEWLEAEEAAQEDEQGAAAVWEVAHEPSSGGELGSFASDADAL